MLLILKNEKQVLMTWFSSSVKNQLSQNLKNLFLIFKRVGSNAGVKVNFGSQKRTNLLID